MEEWAEVRQEYSVEDWQNMEAHYESILADALRFLSRSVTGMTTHGLLERKGFDMSIEDELERRGFIILEAASCRGPTRVYLVEMALVEEALKAKAATAGGQQRLCLA